MSKKSSAAEKFAIGAAIAGLVGFVVGLLTAPKPGKQTRKDLKKTAEKGADEVEKQLKELHAELGKVLKNIEKEAGEKAASSRTKVGKAVVAAAVTKDKLREVLTALHEGEANDSELNNAIQDAKQALESLKDYLKK